uniref:Ribosomal protein L19 n=1 Tax=Gronococcus sybilensis TaxID=3028029 RepID=A0A9Y1I2E1_9RHOD|nr:ribosomal protein L19 [Gronococcus sybilensis]
MKTSEGYQNTTLSNIESLYLKSDIPPIEVGDYLQVGLSIVEGNKERVQVTEGVVIAEKNSGTNASIIVRRTLQGIGVERVFLLHSPKIQTIKILRHSKVRRAKLYFLRNRTGKAARLKKRFK